MTHYNLKVSFRPSLSPQQTEQNLSNLLVRGKIQSSSLDRAILRLDKRFRSYCSFYRYGLWAPGLALTNEMRSCTEQYLPMAEIRSAFRQFFSTALRYSLADESNPFQGATSWLDLLQRLRLSEETLNPATLLARLLVEESDRILFLFRILLPHQHGGSFLRYPDQFDFLKDWIFKNRNFLCHEVRCLDAACGTGEGTYDLADLLIKCGIPPRAQQIHGSSLEPLEVFTAAHGFFPHDPQRQKCFRTVVGPLFTAHATDSMLFFQDDIMRSPVADEKPYDILLCNGLLGGPFMHEQEILDKTVTALAKRLNAGGIILAADRFHGGWKKAGSPKLVEEALVRNGLTLCRIKEGVAAEKPR